MASNQIFIDLSLIKDQLTQITARFGADNLADLQNKAKIDAVAPAAAAAAAVLLGANTVIAVADIIAGNGIGDVNQQKEIIEKYQSQIQSLASMLALAASLAAKSASRTIDELRGQGVPADGAAADAKFGGSKVLKLLKIKMPRIKTTKKASPKKKAAPKKKTVAKKVAPKKAAPKKKTVAPKKK